MTQGHHFIAGQPVTSEDTVTVAGQAYPVGTVADIDAAVTAADAAFPAFAATTRAQRAALLEQIAVEIDARGDAITTVAMAETGLPQARLVGERGRTTGQIRMFAQHILDGDYLDRRHDVALPDRQPLPRPDLLMIQQPIGAVAVFGASNFPLAFSVAGGDTASALASGCPVVVKGHPAHPGTSQIVSEAISAAVAAVDMPAGIFSMVHDGGIPVGAALVNHPAITAVGFTGSLRGGRALFDLCAARPTPIPFFGELGSINPMFLLPEAMNARAAAIGAGWAGSLVMGAGQFCTNPGVVVAIDGPETDAMVAAALAALAETPSQVMLTDGIADAFRKGADQIVSKSAAELKLGNACADRDVTPYLFDVSGDEWLSDTGLHEEVFGPLGLVIRAKDAAQMTQIAQALEGQLTATLHMDDGDTDMAQALLPILARKAGRVLANGYPTGVEVADAMVHSGPYPASTNFGATSVGTMAIRRWLRPVCFQNMPTALTAGLGA